MRATAKFCTCISFDTIVPPGTDIYLCTNCNGATVSDAELDKQAAYRKSRELVQIKKDAWELHKKAKKIWEEDEATRHTEGHVGLTEAMRQHVPGGVLRDKEAFFDYGDCMLAFYKDGWIVCTSYDGESLYKM